jgi:hypothetical protein
MTGLTFRESTRLLLVAAGVICCVVASMIGFGLLRAREMPGVVRIGSTLYRGEPTNYVYVLCDHGTVVHPQPGDWSSAPREGDRVTVLFDSPIGEKGTLLKSHHALWRAWRWVLGFGTVGLLLSGAGLFILRQQLSSHEICTPDAA